MNTIKKLEKLAELYEEAKKREAEKQALIEKLLSPEVKQAISEIEEEFSSGIASVFSSIAGLEAEVKAETVEAGETVKGAGITVVFNRGKVSWETKMIEEYLAKHPKSPVAKARRQGKPYASLNR